MKMLQHMNPRKEGSPGTSARETDFGTHTAIRRASDGNTVLISGADRARRFLDVFFFGRAGRPATRPRSQSEHSNNSESFSERGEQR